MRIQFQTLQAHPSVSQIPQDKSSLVSRLWCSHKRTTRDEARTRTIIFNIFAIRGAMPHSPHFQDSIIRIPLERTFDDSFAYASGELKARNSLHFCLTKFIFCLNPLQCFI